MFLLSSLILFVLHLFVNIKDLTSCLANGRRDAQVEKSRKVENCFDFLRKVSLLSSKEEEGEKSKSRLFDFCQKFRYFQVMTGSGWGGLRGLTH